jgi:hypothetical protein
MASVAKVAPAGSDSTRARYDRLIRRYAAQGRELDKHKSQVAALHAELSAEKADNTRLRSANIKCLVGVAKFKAENEQLRSRLSDISIARFRPDAASPSEYIKVAARLATLAASTGNYSPRQLALITRGAECAIEQGRRLRYAPHPAIIFGALSNNLGGATGLEVTNRYALIAERYNYEWMLACGDISDEDDDEPPPGSSDARYAAYIARTSS